MNCFLYLYPPVILFLCFPLFPQKGLPAPRQVSANSKGVDNIMVTWEPPGKAAPAVQEYVVEWRELHPRGGTQPPLNWLRTTPYNVSALISGT